MRVTKSAGGSPFSQIIYFKPGEIDKMCEDELRKAGCLPSTPQEIDIELFIEKHFRCTLDYADIEPGVLGYTYFDKKGSPKLVGVSPSIDDGTPQGRRRTRSTFAHEAGHCMMHPILFMEEGTPSLPGQNLDHEKKRIMCRAPDFGSNYNGRWWEYQANCAIGGFLLPKQLVCQSCEEFLVGSGGLGIKILPPEQRENAVQHVATVFDVNPAPARIRLEQIFPEKSQNSFL